MGRMGFRSAVAAAAIIAVMASSDTALAQVRSAPMAPSAQDMHAGPSKDELAGLGCLLAGTAAVVAVGAIGIATVAAAGGAVATNVALPVLGTAFAAGCGVGVMAAPGAAYLIDHYVLGIHRVSN